MAKKKTKKEEEVKVVDENLAQLDLVKKAITKKYGEVICSLGDQDDVIVPTLSTGSLSLDIALGRGGLGFGRIYEFYGPNSGGKSTLAAHVIRQAQLAGLKRCCYIDAEHAVDPQLFKNYGINIKDLDLIQGFDGEQNLDILERLIKTGAYSVAVVDSVSALIPRAEAEADIDKDHMALLARLMSKALRKITPIADQTKTIVIFVNQLRMKIGSYGSPSTTTGGEALAFYSTGRISVRGPESKQRRLVDPTSGEVVGHKAEFEVMKNKLAAPFKKAEIKLIYGKGYDFYWEVLDIATSLGIIDKAGAWYKYEGNNLAQGELKMVDYIKEPENRDFFNKIRDEIILQTGLKDMYEQAGQSGPVFT